MNGTLSEILRTRRQNRGLSLNGLALKAGLGKSTLSGWENGKAQPRLVELEAVFAALSVTDSERQEILGLLDAPRMARVLRQAGEEGPPVGGDLLRAMRLRQNRTQQDVAAQIHVSQATLAKWERSDDWPVFARLQALGAALRAHPAELQVLRAGRFTPAPRENSKFDAFVFDARLKQFRHEADLESETLRDLRFLSLEADLCALRQRDEGAERFLTGVCSEHALALMERGRAAEANFYAQRSLGRAQKGIFDRDYWLPAALVTAKQMGDCKKGANPAAAAKMLLDILPNAKFPARRAWFHSDIALYRARAGDLESALQWSAQGCEIARQCQWHGELHFRQCDRAKILLLANRPREAQELCLQSSLLTDCSPSSVPALLLLAETHLALREPDAARQWVMAGLDIIHSRQLEQYRPRAEALQAALAQSE